MTVSRLATGSLLTLALVSAHPASAAEPARPGPSSAAAPRQDAPAAKETAALAAAGAWLALVDAGQYAESWTACAGLFRSAVTQEGWVQALGRTRRPLGGVTRRTLVEKGYKTELPRAPPGEYVVVRYQTAFANKPDAVETVTCTLEKDGRWRTAGYFIR